MTKTINFDRMATCIVKWIYGAFDEENLNHLKAKLGVELILINGSKVGIVYGVAILFATVVPTLITHVPYVFLRKFAQGLHAKSSVVCTVVSLICFVALPYFVQNVSLRRWEVGIIGILLTFLFFKYAPADTENAPILGASNRAYLRKRAVLVSGGLTLFVLMLPSGNIQTLMVFGTILQAVMILPISYKILGRKMNNYEIYE